MNFRTDLLGIGISALLLSAASSSAVADQRRNPPLVGTYVVTIEPPIPAIPAHIGFGSFTPGGVFLASPDIFPPPPAASMGDGYGRWEMTDDGKYAATAVAFSYDKSGAPSGTLKLTFSISMVDKDEFDGTSHLVVCDLNLQCADPSGGPPAKLTFKRLSIEPLAE